MSFRVVRHGDDDDDYACNLRNMQCKFRLANGNRCSRRTIKTIPYCWQHGIKYYRLSVKPSEAVPGNLGVFSLDGFFSGDPVLDHPYGELLTGGVAGDRYGDVANPFLVPTADGRFWDMTCSRGLMGYVQDNADINHVAGGPYNVEYQNIDNGNKIRMVAITNILPGDELLVNKGFDNRQIELQSVSRTIWRRKNSIEYRFNREESSIRRNYRRRMSRNMDNNFMPGPMQ